MKKFFTSIIFATILSTSGFSQTCDTIFNLTLVQDTPVVYLAATGANPGYISGNNLYGDLAKAEGFPAIVGDSLYFAQFYFGEVVISPADSDKPVLFAEWDNTGTSFYNIPGAPGNIIDTATATYREIAASLTALLLGQSFDGLVVNFGHVAIPTDSIYVGVFLPINPATDTLALYTNKISAAQNGNGWELEGDNTWESYGRDWTGFQGLGNYIVVDMCGDVTSGIKNIDKEGAIKIFPNPANDQLNVEWNMNHEAEVDMYDVTGKQVRTFNIQGTSLSTFNIPDLAPGTYIIRVSDRQTNEQQSSLFVKM